MAALFEFDIVAMVAKRFEELGEEESGIKKKNGKKRKKLGKCYKRFRLWLFLHHKDLLFLRIKSFVLFNECIVHITDLALLYMCALFVRQYRSLHAVKDIS